MEDIFKARGMNHAERNQRTDGWVGGRADTWTGHYKEVPASRVTADARRMASDSDYNAAVAESIRRADASIEESLTAAGLSIEPLCPSIGVFVYGVDLADPSDAQIDAISKLYLDRKVVFFRDQGHITREEHIAFGQRISDTGYAYGRQHSLSRRELPNEYPEILRLYASEARPFAASNWHSDVTWSNRPPLGSILLARKSPPVGGDTVFVDAYALWDALDPVLKRFLEGRTAIHGRGGRNEVAHPICRTHPVTKRKALYVNPTFTNSITGMAPDASARLLSDLYAKMYSTPEYQCRFGWQEGSVAMWDNRSFQHYAVGDFWPHDREMERVTLLDRSAEDEIPFWEDADGVRHFGELLTSEAEIATPV